MPYIVDPRLRYALVPSLRQQENAAAYTARRSTFTNWADPCQLE